MLSGRYFWVVALLSAILLWAPLRSGDLAGFDDALYATIAKDMLHSGNWLDERVSGDLAVETHPPMLEWMEGSLFALFGVSDTAARVPSAVCGFLTILLVYWLTRRLTGDRTVALTAMFVMATTLYFIKYCSHGMTDVPVTFFFVCASCAWTLAAERPAWYVGTALAIACATMTRSLTGMLLPPIFLIDAWIANRDAGARKRPWGYVLAAVTLGCVPLFAWYARMLYLYGDIVRQHLSFLSRAVVGEMSPPWRKYTGAIEYAWMLAKSYWPWLPAMIAGIVAIYKKRDRRLYLLLAWAAMVFALCAVVKSRVLRYMLPAYPAYAMLAACGIAQFIPRIYLERALRIGIGVFASAVIAVAVSERTQLLPRANLNIGDVRPIALASTAATSPGERVVFYDGGLRTDEVNQMEWYGDRWIIMPLDHDELMRTLAGLPARVFVMDDATYRSDVDGRIANQVAGRSGHFVCFRVAR